MGAPSIDPATGRGTNAFTCSIALVLVSYRSKAGIGPEIITYPKNYCVTAGKSLLRLQCIVVRCAEKSGRYRLSHLEKSVASRLFQSTPSVIVALIAAERSYGKRARPTSAKLQAHCSSVSVRSLTSGGRVTAVPIPFIVWSDCP